jgi:tetratricopeptide (TPR) repeat protein
MVRCAALVVSAVVAASFRAAAAGPAADAGNPADARFEAAGALVARARVELSATPVGNPAEAKQSLRRAEAWLRQALAQQPRDVFALLALGDVLARTGRAGEAVPIIERACALARGPAEVFPCSLALAAARAHAGQLVDALREYDRHLEIADPRTLPTVHIKAAELQMALGRLDQAEARFDKAIGLLDQGQIRPGRDSQRALALYGLAVAHDRAARDLDARQAMGQALGHDPGMALLDAAADPYSGAALVPAAEVHYYRGLALVVLGKGAEAMQAFQRFLALQPDSRWRKQAESHLHALEAAGAEAPPRPPRRARVVAAATVLSEGPLPAPLIDAAWRSRPRLLQPCLDAVPDSAPNTLRMSLSLEIDARGVLRQVAVELGPDVGFGVSPAWLDFEACVSRRVKSGLRVARPTRHAVTSARLEIVLAIRRQDADP